MIAFLGLLRSKLVLWAGIALGALLVVLRILAYGKAAGRADELAKQEKAREEDRKRLQEAIRAGDAVRDDDDSIMHDVDNRARRR